MGWVNTIVNLAVYVLAIWLMCSLFRLGRVKSLVAAVLGVLLSKGLMSIIPPLGIATGYINMAAIIICVTLIAWLFGRHRVKSLLATTLGVLLGSLANTLIANVLNTIFG